MKTTKIPAKDQTPEAAASITLGLDVETLMAVAAKVSAEGFVSAEALREEFGAERFTKSIAVLYRNYRMLREVRRPFGDDGKPTLGYEWADKRFSQAEAKKVPATLGFLVAMGAHATAKYTDFQDVTVKCRWTNHILGAIPSKDGEDDINVFERDADGSVLIPAYCLRAMASQALPLIGKEAAAARHIRFRAVRVEDPKILEAKHGITEVGRSGGKGIRRSEKIAAGTEFEIRAMVPTSVIPVADYMRMLALAGEFIRFSPARSAGYGDFLVLGEA